MIARSIAATALAGAVALAPTAAFGYGSEDAALTCSATQVTVTQQFECVGTGPEGASAALQATTSGENATFIAGTVTSAEKTVVDGEATWTVEAPSTAGVIGFTLLVDGEAADTATVDVVADSAASGSDELSSTGFENTALAAGAGVLLVAGAATVFVAARRRASQNA
ncbi:hypothetical protein [Demequina rhizosphaerae]|uniref:hypothetical protein n=1 Tax=Demequina rhizosphaerae TaxID=1638985 RepID=UPI00078251B7|nr:hypothetical protein [Demequina rhizosphaerae]